MPFSALGSWGLGTRLKVSVVLYKDRFLRNAMMISARSFKSPPSPSLMSNWGTQSVLIYMEERTCWKTWEGFWRLSRCQYIKSLALGVYSFDIPFWRHGCRLALCARCNLGANSWRSESFAARWKWGNNPAMAHYRFNSVYCQHDGNAPLGSMEA